MKKLLFLFILLSYTTQNNPIFDPPNVVNYITQPLISPTKDHRLPVELDQKKPITVSIDSKSTENFIEKVMEKIDERTEGLLENNIENFNDILKESIVPELKKSWQLIVGSFLNSENALRFGWPIALFGITAISGLYGTHVLWKFIEKKVLYPKPAILQPGSKYGWLDRWKRSRTNYTTPSMIFDDSVKERLEEIQEKTKNIREHIRQGKKVTYDNLLLYGKPGTGKTFFAQILADITDMDFLSVTAASLLQSGIEGIKYFDEIVEMAAKSKYGVILFIDEADALFINRDTLNPESDHYKLLNHILAATGNGSSTMMMIAATNHAHIMDPAMGRRFQDRIKMPLPNEQTRKDLINLYIKEYLNTSDIF